MLDRIRIVLIGTSHPGNIGAAARAMKTMGLSQLYLVEPKEFPHPKALEMASGAGDLVESAKVVSTLDEAIGDCQLVVGTSARDRKIPWPLLSPRAVVQKIKNEPGDADIAIVFGRERTGLLNDELRRCQIHIQIPANPEYPSLNLAAAVQVLAYECRVASFEQDTIEEVWDHRRATSHELELLFKHLESALIKLRFLKPKSPRQLMTRLRRFFFRAHPDEMEVNIFRGILSAIESDSDALKALKHNSHTE